MEALSSLSLLLFIAAATSLPIEISRSHHLPGELYYLSNSKLRNSSQLPNGSRWSSVLNQTSPAYPQLHFFCERLAMFDLTSALKRSFPHNQKITNKEQALSLTMQSTCRLWNCSTNPQVQCVTQERDCPDLEVFLTKMRKYCPKILLANDQLWKEDLAGQKDFQLKLPLQ